MIQLNACSGPARRLENSVDRALRNIDDALAAAKAARYQMDARKKEFETVCRRVSPPKHVIESFWQWPVAAPPSTDLTERNIIPGYHGIAHVASQEQFQWYCSYIFRLVIDGGVDYGIYRAFPLPGKGIHGVEFAQLDSQERQNIIERMSQAGKNTPAYTDIQTALLCSARDVPCLFFQCLEKPPTLPFNPNFNISSSSGLLSPLLLRSRQSSVIMIQPRAPPQDSLFLARATLTSSISSRASFSVTEAVIHELEGPESKGHKFYTSESQGKPSKDVTCSMDGDSIRLGPKSDAEPKNSGSSKNGLKGTRNNPGNHVGRNGLSKRRPRKVLPPRFIAALQSNM